MPPSVVMPTKNAFERLSNATPSVRRGDGRADRQGEHGQDRDECPLHVDRTS
jgi:hypothetical protein